MANTDIKDTPSGLIRYVLLVVSSPNQTTTADMCKLVMDILPNFEKQQDGTAKISLLWKTEHMNTIDVPALAIEIFGNEMIDANRFVYRMLPMQLVDGEASCFVVYDADPK